MNDSLVSLVVVVVCVYGFSFVQIQCTGHVFCIYYCSIGPISLKM